MGRLFSFWIFTTARQAAIDCSVYGENGMKKLKLVMIGNGMAGVRTLEELLKLSLHDALPI